MSLTSDRINRIMESITEDTNTKLLRHALRRDDGKPMTQAQLAVEVGLDRATIQRQETKGLVLWPKNREKYLDYVKVKRQLIRKRLAKLRAKELRAIASMI